MRATILIPFMALLPFYSLVQSTGAPDPSTEICSPLQDAKAGGEVTKASTPWFKQLKKNIPLYKNSIAYGKDNRLSKGILAEDFEFSPVGYTKTFVAKKGTWIEFHADDRAVRAEFLGSVYSFTTKNEILHPAAWSPKKDSHRKAGIVVQLSFVKYEDRPDFVQVLY